MATSYVYSVVLRHYQLVQTNLYQVENRRNDSIIANSTRSI